MSEIIIKNRILQSAYTLFAKDGYSATSIKKVAQELSISTSLIFHHFKSKEALWACVEYYAIQTHKGTPPEIRVDTVENFIEDCVNYRFHMYEDETFRRFFHWRALENHPKNSEREVPQKPISGPNSFIIYQAVEHLQKNHIIRQDIEAHVLGGVIFACSSYAIWDYADYYDLTSAQIESYKVFVKKSLVLLLKP